MQQDSVGCTTAREARDSRSLFAGPWLAAARTWVCKCRWTCQARAVERSQGCARGPLQFPVSLLPGNIPNTNCTREACNTNACFDIDSNTSFPTARKAQLRTTLQANRMPHACRSEARKNRSPSQRSGAARSMISSSKSSSGSGRQSSDAQQNTCEGLHDQHDQHDGSHHNESQMLRIITYNGTYK